MIQLLGYSAAEVLAGATESTRTGDKGLGGMLAAQTCNTDSFSEGPYGCPQPGTTTARLSSRTPPGIARHTPTQWLGHSTRCSPQLLEEHRSYEA